MTTVATASDTQVARPLRVLVPLIKEELDAGYRAGLEHYRRAGELLIEAKSQLQHGEWRAWLKRNFVLSHETARRYMTLARENQTARSSVAFRPRTLSEVMGDFRKYPERSGALGASGKDVRRIVSQVDVDRLAKERQSREREAKLTKELAHTLIDIGYRVLAAKLHHPDREGSTEAMARLNHVRTLLRRAIAYEIMELSRTETEGR
jgi:Protein of unknown function (DUF3102)